MKKVSVKLYFFEVCEKC